MLLAVACSCAVCCVLCFFGVVAGVAVLACSLPFCVFVCVLSPPFFLFGVCFFFAVCVFARVCVCACVFISFFCVCVFCVLLLLC